MTQIRFADLFGKRGETTVEMGPAMTGDERGLDYLCDQHLTPGRGSKQGQAACKVVYVISRQTQYIVIGQHAAGLDTHSGKTFDNYGGGLVPNSGLGWPGTWQENTGQSGQPFENIIYCRDRLPEAPPDIQNVAKQLPGLILDSGNDAACSARHDKTNVVSTIRDVPDYVTGKTNESTPKHHSKNLHAKLKRKRNTRKLARKLIRSVETSFWSELDAASEPDVDQSVEFPTSLQDVREEPKAGNQSGQVVNSTQARGSDSKPCWEVSREQLKIFLGHFWQKHPCNGEDQSEFERLNAVIENSADWASAKHCLKAHLLITGIETDKVERLAEEVLSDVFFEVLDRCQAAESDESELVENPGVRPSGIMAVMSCYRMVGPDLSTSVSHVSEPSESTMMSH